MSFQSVSLPQSSKISLSTGEIHIWQVELDVEDKPCQPLWGMLDGLEQQRALRFRDEEIQKKYIWCHGLRRILLSRYLDLEPQEIRYFIGPFGKPHLDLPSELHFNMSHTDTLAIFAITSFQSIGIDVERLLSIEEIESLECWFLSKEEKLQLASLPHMERLEAFYTYWVSKEAYLKMLGLGLDDRLDTYNMIPHLAGEQADWGLDIYYPISGYIAALAASGPVRQVLGLKCVASQFLF